LTSATTMRTVLLFGEPVCDGHHRLVDCYGLDSRSKSPHLPAMLSRSVRSRLNGFIEPCLPSAADRPPAGSVAGAGQADARPMPRSSPPETLDGTRQRDKRTAWLTYWTRGCGWF
jgi:hypothetical protein